MNFTNTSISLVFFIITLSVCLVSWPPVVGEDGLIQDYYHDSCPQAEQIIASTLRELYAVNMSVAPALLRLLFHDYCFVMSGGPFYPVLTSRKDSMDAFPSDALNDIPSPNSNFKEALDSFASKGFDARETVALLGAHSTGKIHCPFIASRLSNFNGTDGPDSSINPAFLEVLKSECSKEDGALSMDYQGARKGFGELYYRSLLQGRGLLFVDQQLTSGPQTKPLLQTYAADVPRFRDEFGAAMFKLSNLQVAKEKEGQVRISCRRLN